ncbi:PDZ domain-containing protein [Pseudomonas sp. NPDC086278]|uniref:PDZ domain-containing protein n=1 Tax=Pseudomonas sp. NPDC086278 TaxID=3390646 RepID=UPI003D03D3E4
MSAEWKRAGKIAGAVLLMSSLSGCILDPVYLIGAAVSAGDDDTPVAAAGSAASLSEADNSANLQKMITREVPDRYRPRNCDYIEMALSEVPGYQSSTNAYLKQAGEARKVAASQVWLEKGCTSGNFPSGKVGISMETIDAQKAAMSGLPTSGVVIYSTVAGSPAQQAGILPNDVVVAVDEQPIADSIDFRVLVAKAPLGSTVRLKVWRYLAFQTVPVVVGAGGTQVSMLPASAPSAKASASASANTSTSSLQGMNLGTVTASYAKAVGLPSAQGAWVIDTVKGSPADKAGIKPLDVIVEVSGQEVASAQDMADISSKMRVGYKATVSVWRNQAKRDVQVVLKNE